jgi:hypothetical protein
LFRIVLFQTIYQNLLWRAGKATFNQKLFLICALGGNFQPFSTSSTEALGKRYGMRRKKLAIDEVVFASILLDERSRLRVAWRPIYLLS